MPHVRFAILAQKLRDLLHGSAPRRLLLALVLPFFRLMGAFGLAPDPASVTSYTARVC